MIRTSVVEKNLGVANQAAADAAAAADQNAAAIEKIGLGEAALRQVAAAKATASDLLFLLQLQQGKKESGSVANEK